MRILFISIFMFIGAGTVFSQQLRPFSSANKKWGFVNEKGQQVIPAKYDGVMAFSEDMAAVQRNGLWGFINKSGVEVVKPTYFTVMPFSEGKAYVWNGKGGFINKNGAIVIPMRYDVAISFKDGTARVFKDGKWSYINHLGLPVAGPAATSPSNTPLRNPNKPAEFSFIFAFDRNASNQLEWNPSISYIRRNGVLESIVTSLNSILKLPYEVNISFQKINTPNAYYHGEEKRIYFGVEFINLIYNSLKTQYQGQQLLDATTDAVVYILFHEIGHALIDIYNLPTSAGEESSADNFATYLFTRGNERLEQIALNGAQLFFNLSKDQKFISAMVLADEHLLSAQRAYIIMCYLYGKNPQKYRYLVDSGILAIDERRQHVCRADYQKLIRSWDELLKNWRK